MGDGDVDVLVVGHVERLQNLGGNLEETGARVDLLALDGDGSGQTEQVHRDVLLHRETEQLLLFAFGGAAVDVADVVAGDVRHSPLVHPGVEGDVEGDERHRRSGDADGVGHETEVGGLRDHLLQGLGRTRG